MNYYIFFFPLVNRAHHFNRVGGCPEVSFEAHSLFLEYSKNRFEPLNALGYDVLRRRQVGMSKVSSGENEAPGKKERHQHHHAGLIDLLGAMLQAREKREKAKSKKALLHT